MTIEEKAKRYDEAIKIAKEINNEHKAQSFDVMLKVFPELAEPEDEKIRKAIIKFIKVSKPEWENYSDYSSWIAWLEKQEWKPSDKQIKVLKAIKDYTIFNNWNDCICNTLKDLLEQLEKL